MIAKPVFHAWASTKKTSAPEAALVPVKAVLPIAQPTLLATTLTKAASTACLSASLLP
jgi:hypothetical protein